MQLPGVETAFAVTAALAVLSLFVERGLSLVFEHPLWIRLVPIKGVKEIIALFVCWRVAVLLGFDAIQAVAGHPDSHSLTLWLTAATMAGGGKGWQKMFVDLMDIQSSAARRASGGAP